MSDLKSREAAASALERFKAIGVIVSIESIGALVAAAIEGAISKIDKCFGYWNWGYISLLYECRGLVIGSEDRGLCHWCIYIAQFCKTYREDGITRSSASDLRLLLQVWHRRIHIVFGMDNGKSQTRFSEGL